MQEYTGKPTSGGPEKRQGMQIVFDVTEGLKGHIVTCDNFFTSHELGQQLLKRKITMVDTALKNKPEIPPVLLALKGREALLSICLLPHHHPSFLHPKEKQECGPPEHTAQSSCHQ